MFQATMLVLVIGLPFCAVFFLGVPAWFGVKMSEETVARIVGGTFILVTLAALALTGCVIVDEHHAKDIDLGSFYSVGEYSFKLTLVGDGLSATFAAFSAILVGVIGVFSRRYLHREPGFFRFYFLLTLFGAGVLTVVLAGNLDLVFFGWELVGVTSALLIAFFHERKKPVEHALRAFLTYRICDVGLLGAAVWLHHKAAATAMVASPDAPWIGFAAPSSERDTLLIALLLLWASMGKAAQMPLGGWLPRAMEGPTPSSAIFYGAISIHLGPYLLLRAGPLIESSAVASAAVVGVGALTAIHAALVGRVQTDIKSSLAYASMAQVGLIFVEIGLGWRLIPLIHIVGHAAVRSHQLLRSPSLLHDHHQLEQAMGGVPRLGGHLQRWIPLSSRARLYRYALERGGFDAILREHIVGGFLSVFTKLDNVERRVARALRSVSPRSNTKGDHS